MYICIYICISTSINTFFGEASSNFLKFQYVLFKEYDQIRNVRVWDDQDYETESFEGSQNVTNLIYVMYSFINFLFNCYSRKMCFVLPTIANIYFSFCKRLYGRSYLQIKLNRSVYLTHPLKTFPNLHWIFTLLSENGSF